MRPSTPTWLLASLGALSLAGASRSWAVDTSQWTCETCPFEKEGTTGTIDVGIGGVSDDSAKFGDYTGLDQQGAFLIAGGRVRYRGKDGWYGNLSASDLGLDSRSLAADGGREGRFSARLGYAEIPRHYTDTASSPFLGMGSAVLTLPPGFPAPDTASMPLAATLQPADLSLKYSRLDLGATLAGPADWQYRVDVRRDVRDGTKRSAGSFFSTTSQLVAPVNQVTDQIEVSASYTGTRLQATLSYSASSFRNDDSALTWQSPFTAIVAGATAGQLALPPDNEFHQVLGTAGYQVTPTVRVSGEVAVGRMKQNDAYLAPTLNGTLVVPPLPAGSLQGSADTLDAAVRVTFAPTERLRLAAALMRNERDNHTPSLAYPVVTTDMFVGTDTRINLPYSFTRDRVRLSGDWRGTNTLKISAGADYDTQHRTLQETDKTREGTVWGRLAVQASAMVGLELKLSHSDRDNTGYGVVPSVQPPQNPLMRKYNLADRKRNAATLRADVALAEGISIGGNIEGSDDDYSDSTVGLTSAHSLGAGADLTAVIAENTQVRAWYQGEQIRSSQAGSQQFGAPDWKGKSQDELDSIGIGITHAAMKGKLDLGADLAWTRSHGHSTVQIGAASSPFPTAKATRETLTLHATWRKSDKLSVLGSLSYEHYDETDWHLDGVQPATVPNLLAFGEQPPNYRVGVVRVALRYGF
jgi:MtrB/PioB family decaheme-associated outer membrane protein